MSDRERQNRQRKGKSDILNLEYLRFKELCTTRRCKYNDLTFAVP